MAVKEIAKENSILKKGIVLQNKKIELQVSQLHEMEVLRDEL